LGLEKRTCWVKFKPPSNASSEKGVGSKNRQEKGNNLYKRKEVDLTRPQTKGPAPKTQVTEGGVKTRGIMV